MRRLIAISLITILTFPFLLKIGIVSNYALHKDFYAKILCINQEKPELSCEGKCALNKELKSTEGKDGEQENSLPVKVLKVNISEFLSTENQFCYTPALLETILMGKCIPFHSIFFKNLEYPPPEFA